MTTQNNYTWEFTGDKTGEEQVFNPTSPLQFVVSGTLGGGTVTLESKISNSDFNTIGSMVTTGVLNGTTDGRIFCTAGEIFRASVSGSTTPTIKAQLLELIT